MRFSPEKLKAIVMVLGAMLRRNRCKKKMIFQLPNATATHSKSAVVIRVRMASCGARKVSCAHS